MREYIFTDLACEKEIEQEETVQLTKTITLRKTYTNLREGTCKGERYASFFTPKLWNLSDEDFSFLSKAIARELQTLMSCFLPKEKTSSIMIAGLGNSEITPDALGPETAKKITVTRHLYSDERFPPICKRYHSISSVIPGVLANTGIETVEFLKGAVARVKPDLLIAVDSLAARSPHRLATTIQLSDRGILPGSGIGNHQKAISADTLKIPVIAVGVPMVIHSSTLIRDALEQSDRLYHSEGIESLLKGYGGFFVTPKETDLLVKSASFLLSTAIDLACTIGQE